MIFLYILTIYLPKLLKLWKIKNVGPYLIIFLRGNLIGLPTTKFGRRLHLLPLCSLRVTVIREFNFVPLENQGIL